MPAPKTTVASRRPAKAAAVTGRPGPTHRAPIAAAHFVDDAFFRHLVAHMRNGVLAIDRGGALVLINDEACRIFGLPAGEGYMGRPFAEVFHAHPAIVRVLAGAYELAFLPNRAELRLSPSDKVLGYTLSLIRNAEGLTIGAAMFFKDLTRVEQLEERERLRDRLAVLGEMAAAVAHEIKNPLAGIEVMAGLLRRQLKDDTQATALVGDIINEAKMANAIVQEILDFVRPVRLQMERTSVASAIQAAVTMADGKATRGDVDVALSLDEALPLIDADRTQLMQVFANLLINAFEALDGRGRVTISAREVHREEDGALPLDGLHPMPTVVVEVTDDGPGVPPELADKIFSAFFTTKAQGSGLGLAIVRKIVDAHDGRIDMTSRPGAGTKFRVALPVSGDARVW
ncbi:MAG: ATP-binding protein [Vicinamibacterales bacterium]